MSIFVTSQVSAVSDIFHSLLLDDVTLSTKRSITSTKEQTYNRKNSTNYYSNGTPCIALGDIYWCLSYYSFIKEEVCFPLNRWHKMQVAKTKRASLGEH